MKDIDHSKIDGIPNERWYLAEIIYTAIKRELWGDALDSTPPKREGYTHGKQVADFDLALVSARAVLAAGYQKN